MQTPQKEKQRRDGKIAITSIFQSTFHPWKFFILSFFGRPKKHLNFIFEMKTCFYRRVLFYIKTFLLIFVKFFNYWHTSLVLLFHQLQLTESNSLSISTRCSVFFAFSLSVTLASLLLQLAPPSVSSSFLLSGHLSSFTPLSPIPPSSRPTHRQTHTHTHTRPPWLQLSSNTSLAHDLRNIPSWLHTNVIPTKLD